MIKIGAAAFSRLARTGSCRAGLDRLAEEERPWAAEEEP